MHNTHMHLQRLGLQGLHNVASTIVHSHCLDFTYTVIHHTTRNAHTGGDETKSCKQVLSTV